MINYTQCKQLKNKPNFLVVGATKSGTTSLNKYFQSHPEIYVHPKIKETNYFIQPKEVLGNGPRFYGKDSYGISTEAYAGLFRDIPATTKAIGEVCPTYLPLHEYTIPNILEGLGEEVKIIIILRNPIDRAYSHYMHNVRDTDETLSFEQALQQEEQRIKDNLWISFRLTQVGLYAKQVKAYLDNFKQVKIFLFDDMKNEDFFPELFSFLEVNPNIKINTQKRHNVSGKPKNLFLQKNLVNETPLKTTIKKILKPFVSESLKQRLYSAQEKLINKNIKKIPMNPETRNQLKEVFRDDILHLEKIINRDLSHWLK